MDFVKQHSFALGITAASVAVGLGIYFHLQAHSQPKIVSRGSVEELPVVDLTPYLNREKFPEEAAAEIKKVAYAFHKFGCVVIRDPRVEEEHNTRFLDMMQSYFEQSDGKKDARPEVGFQVGVTPENTEVPRNHCAAIAEFDELDRPVTLCPPGADPKWRFFWRIGPQPKETKYPALNDDAVIPEEFPEWKGTMNMWGDKMLAALHVLAGMAAEGLDLPPTLFQDMMACGPHLLAPTGSDFNKYNKLHTALAGYHYDLNFMTIHGKSRFPGLFVWLRDGRRVPVKVPDGHLIVQAGKEFEILTGGHVLAGYHEVVVSEATQKTIANRKREGKSLWRVSSTLFGHIASDQVLQPLGKYNTAESRAKWHAKDAGQHITDELDAIALSGKMA